MMGFPLISLSDNPKGTLNTTRPSFSLNGIDEYKQHIPMWDGGFHVRSPIRRQPPFTAFPQPRNTTLHTKHNKKKEQKVRGSLHSHTGNCPRHRSTGPQAPIELRQVPADLLGFGLCGVGQRLPQRPHGGGIKKTPGRAAFFLCPNSDPRIISLV